MVMENEIKDNLGMAQKLNEHSVLVFSMENVNHVSKHKMDNRKENMEMKSTTSKVEAKLCSSQTGLGTSHYRIWKKVKRERLMQS